MALDIEDAIAGLNPERRRRIEERAAELIAEEMTLRELRKARELTQASIARELGIGQDAVSRLEQRSDLLLSTLRKTVEQWAAACPSSHGSPTAPRSNSSALPNISLATDTDADSPSSPRMRGDRQSISEQPSETRHRLLHDDVRMGTI